MAAAGFVQQSSAAIYLSLEPSAPTISVGDSVSLDLVIGGFGDFTAPSLGGFAVQLAYNEAVLSATGLTFGGSLDFGTGSLRDSDLSTLGLILFSEVSFELPADLNANQPGTFTLATLDFTGLAAGMSDLTFGLVELSNEEGFEIMGFGTTPASVTVVTAVPEPASSGVLLGFALAVAWLRSRC